MPDPAPRPIGDYAAIGDRRTAALVARDGSIDWWCVPRFDSPALLCRLLDQSRGGSFLVAPRNVKGVTRRYLDGSNVLETTFQADDGVIRLTDFMPWHPGRDGPCTIVRRVEAVAGSPSLRVRFEPTPDFARKAVEFTPGAGAMLGRCPDFSLRLSLNPAADLRLAAGVVETETALVQGHELWISLEAREDGAWDDAPRPLMLQDLLDRTVRAWRRWASRCELPGHNRDLVVRSALALKMLTYEPSGGIVAAVTTSLPEVPGGTANWDYRYAWLRDASWTLDALMSIGHHDEPFAFWRWLERVAERADSDLSIMYTLDGDEVPPEVELDHLAGYGGARPVRVGNTAAQQMQLDIFGELLDGLYRCSEARAEMRPLHPELWRHLCSMAESVAEKWHEPDHGLWEIRGPPRHYVSSKAQCWSALDRAIRIAERDGLHAPLDRWREARRAVRELVLTRGFNERLGAFTQTIDGQSLDAAVLLVPRTGLLPASDPRVRSTIQRLRERLERRGLLYRFEHDGESAHGEGAFLLCSFWLVEILAMAGDVEEAARVFQRTASVTNDVGLLSEQADPETGALWGNFPQALSHLGLVRAASRLAQARHAAGLEPSDLPAR